MALLDDKIAALTATADRMIADLASLRSQLATAQASATTPAQLAALDALQAKLDTAEPAA